MSNTVSTPRPGPAGTRRSQLSISGMTCGNCARHVTDAIQRVPGVHSAMVSLDAHQASVRWAADATPDPAAVVRAVEEEGYGAKVITAHEHSAGETKVAGWQLNLWIGVLGTIPLMLGDWVLGLGGAAWFQRFSLAVAGLVQIFAGAPFYRGAWNQLKVGSSNMDTLVALGSSTAFAYSAWALFRGPAGHLYFMEAAAIITLISVGHWIESRVSLRASGALRQLLNLAPSVARRRNADGSEVDVPVADLKAGDLIALRPGDRVPTDGQVLEGNSAVDEAMLTGESIPVDKTAGSPLYAGTVNLNGKLLMRTTAVGEETALAHIIAAVQRAQSSRARIQRLGDQVSSVFVPVVVAIAILAGLWWGLAPERANATAGWLSHYLWPAHPPAGSLAAAFITAAAVLIIACPCAMGLATPAAIMAGSNAAARRGILIRDGVALEKAGEVTSVIFDKTGTLTTGKPKVVQAWSGPRLAAASLTSGENPSDEVNRPPWPLAAALAAHSSHPISQAVARQFTGQSSLTNWRELRGAGVQAEWRGEDRSGTARLGSVRWLRECGVDFSHAEKQISESAARGATIIGLAIDRSLEALFAVNDTVKPGALKVVQQLQRQGFKIYLVTGDNTLTALGIAKQVGIDPGQVFAEIRPEQKAEFVKRLQEQAEHVAFVGDGINDAPALEQADLGIAVSRASDIAREAADIILLNSEIEAIPESLGLARATLRTIRQNLFWAFFYNAIGIPLAALGFMSPILCAAAMGFSDLIVIGNALRLRRWRLPADY